MRRLYISKDDCCGCTACSNICPNSAIVMLPDNEGFFYPIIDYDLCIDCDLCLSVCPIQNVSEITNIYLKAYALKHKNDDVRLKSSSGGAYTAISDYIYLQANSVIYGVAYNEEFNVYHMRTNSLIKRDSFRGSKYIQSNLIGIFLKVKQDLEHKKKVLFTGTPCQIAGLKCYLKNAKVDFDNLILNDFVCHGTTSPKLWNDYINYIENRYNSKLVGYTFRDKNLGWRGYNVKATFQNGINIVNTDLIRTYINLFSSNLTLRPSCYDCKFKNIKRPSDITIADFWGIENILPEFEDKEYGISKGVSLVLVNTKKGQEIFSKIIDNVLYEPVSIEGNLQVNLKQPTKKPLYREKFWTDYINYGYEYIARKYAGNNYISKIKKRVVWLLTKLKIVGLLKRWLKLKR